MGWKLLEVEKVRAGKRSKLEDVMEAYEHIVKEGKVARALPINPETGELLSGFELYEALRLLSVPKVPVTDDGEGGTSTYRWRPLGLKRSSVLGPEYLTTP